MQDWDRLPLIVVLKRITNGSSLDNMKLEIIEHVMEIGGLSRDELGNKDVSFGVDDVSVFQGVCIGVTMQLKQGLPLCHRHPLHVSLYQASYTNSLEVCHCAEDKGSSLISLWVCSTTILSVAKS